MEKIGLLIKETSENIIKDSVKDSTAVIVINYLGLSSPDISNLRQSLRKSNARLFVVKNTVARRALKDTGLEPLVAAVDGPCGLVFVKDEPIGASKALWGFAKEHENLKYELGFLNDKSITKADIDSIAKLPGIEVLRAQVVMALNAPIQGLVLTLNQVIKKFVYCLDQIKQKKDVQKQ